MSNRRASAVNGPIVLLTETSRPRFVAGAIGPLTVSLSNSPDPDDAGFRVVTFDQVKTAYAQQVRALIAGGVDLLLVETIFDSLNAKAALVAIREVFDQDGEQLPIMISAAVGRGGETLISAQTTEAFWNAVQAREAAVGGPQLLARSRPDVSVPGGALGEGGRGHLLLPERRLAESALRDRLRSGPARHGPLSGRLCPRRADQHCRRLLRQHPRAHRGHRQSARRPASAPVGHPERDNRVSVTEDTETKPLRLSGSQPFTQQPGVYIMIGERTNVAGSPRFAKLVKEGKFEEAVSVARQQVENGANVLDICMDEGMIDGVAAMTRYLQLLASEPEVAKVPFMVDSSKWEVIEAGLKCLQGKGIVNSISLKEGEDKFRHNAATVLKYGAAVVVMAFDEQGQAATYEEKIRICERAYRILVDEVGIPARRHHLRPQHPHRGHRHGGAQQLRGRLHQRHPLDQGQPAPRQGQRRRLQHLLQLSRQQQSARGHALRLSLSRHRRRHGHGHRQRRHARGLRGDRAGT